MAETGQDVRRARGRRPPVSSWGPWVEQTDESRFQRSLEFLLLQSAHQDLGGTQLGEGLRRRRARFFCDHQDRQVGLSRVNGLRGLQHKFGRGHQVQDGGLRRKFAEKVNRFRRQFGDEDRMTMRGEKTLDQTGREGFLGVQEQDGGRGHTGLGF